MNWRSIETIPMDGTEILIKTHVGIVSAWFCHEEPTGDATGDGCDVWICYDGVFQLHKNVPITGWMPISVGVKRCFNCRVEEGRQHLRNCHMFGMFKG